jgi:hypothetical protein
MTEDIGRYPDIVFENERIVEELVAVFSFSSLRRIRILPIAFETCGFVICRGDIGLNAMSFQLPGMWHQEQQHSPLHNQQQQHAFFHNQQPLKHEHVPNQFASRFGLTTSAPLSPCSSTAPAIDHQQQRIQQHQHFSLDLDQSPKSLVTFALIFANHVPFCHVTYVLPFQPPTSHSCVSALHMLH